MNDKHLNVVLVGNPNTGKSSLFNSITGKKLKVGNWPGTTVEKKEAVIYYKGFDLNLIDLPGVFSVDPYSEEEKVSHKFLMHEDVDVIVQVVDVNTLTRNLLMTFELLTLGKPVVIALNFNKEASNKGLRVDEKKLGQMLQLWLVKLEANTGENKEDLLDLVVKCSDNAFILPYYMNDLVDCDGKIDLKLAVKFIKRKRDTIYFANAANPNFLDKIDKVVLNRFTAFPILMFTMYVMFYITFNLTTPLVNGLDWLFTWLGALIRMLPLPQFVESYVVDGLVGGVGIVLSFTPLMFSLSFLMSWLGDSGYLARTVILVDRLFKKLGVSGRSFIPMVLGFGCNVPAIMATRTITNKKERMIAIAVNPFMSCGARLPVYALFASVFFEEYYMAMVMFLYSLGLFVTLSGSLILSKLITDSEGGNHLFELPPYRLPNLKNVTTYAWYKMRMFVKKTGTLIVSFVTIIWLLANLPLGAVYASDQSLLGILGRSISWIFAPLGFPHWAFAVALFMGVNAKEIIVATLGTLLGGDLNVSLPDYISKAASLAFMVFILLYTPCMSALGAIRRETGSVKFVVFQAVGQFGVAWVVAFLVYRGALWLGV